MLKRRLSKSKSVSRISRKTKIGISIFTGLALATGAHFAAVEKFGRAYLKRVPVVSHVYQDKNTSVDFWFSVHSNWRDLKPLEQELKSAKARGEPYNLLFLEGANIEISERRKLENKINQKINDARKHLIESGVLEKISKLEKEISFFLGKMSKGKGKGKTQTEIIAELYSEYKKNYGTYPPELSRQSANSLQSTASELISGKVIFPDNKGNYERLKSLIVEHWSNVRQAQFYEARATSNSIHPIQIEEIMKREPGKFSYKSFPTFSEHRKVVAARHGLYLKYAEAYTKGEIERMAKLFSELERYLLVTPEEAVKMLARNKEAKRAVVKALAEYYFIRDSGISRTVQEGLREIRELNEFKEKKVKAIVLLGSTHHNAFLLLDRASRATIDRKGEKFHELSVPIKEALFEALELSKKGLNSIREY